MTKCLQIVIMTKARISRLTQVGNIYCKKCNKEFMLNDETLKKKKKGGRHKYYHKDCYEMIYI